MDREAWRAAVHGVVKSWTRLSNWTELNWISWPIAWSFWWSAPIPPATSHVISIWKTSITLDPPRVLGAVHQEPGTSQLDSPSQPQRAAEALALRVRHFGQLKPLTPAALRFSICVSLLVSPERSPVTYSSIQVWEFSSVQSLSRVRIFETPWIAARQASLSITNSWSSLRLTSIESVMPSSHLILCRPLLLFPPIPPSIRVFSNESTLLMGWQSTGVSASASFPPKKSQGWSPSEWTGWISLQSKGLSRVFSNTTVQKHQHFSAQLSL